MTGAIRIFVNERGLLVPAGATVSEAVTAFDPSLAGSLEGGGATVTDARGIAVAPDAPLFAGAILRVIVSARRNREPGDAHP